jgi:HSP20 family molecular chaperone IbpA
VDHVADFQPAATESRMVAYRLPGATSIDHPEACMEENNLRLRVRKRLARQTVSLENPGCSSDRRDDQLSTTSTRSIVRSCLAFRGPRPLLRRAEGWLPDVEMLQRNNQLVIRADLPGLAKDDIKVDVTEDAVTIQGERRREHEEEKAGVYRSERSYGSFSPVVALPQGAITDQAKASFKDGVLEITMPAPPETVTLGRKLEITEATTTKK